MTDIFQEELKGIEKFKSAKRENGSVKQSIDSMKPDFEVALTQQAYIDGPASATPHYKAAGIDMYGNDYEITWEVKENWEQIEDESEMCDWENPEEIKPL